MKDSDENLFPSQEDISQQQQDHLSQQQHGFSEERRRSPWLQGLQQPIQPSSQCYLQQQLLQGGLARFGCYVPQLRLPPLQMHQNQQPSQITMVQRDHTRQQLQPGFTQFQLQAQQHTQGYQHLAYTVPQANLHSLNFARIYENAKHASSEVLLDNYVEQGFSLDPLTVIERVRLTPASLLAAKEMHEAVERLRVRGANRNMIAFGYAFTCQKERVDEYIAKYEIDLRKVVAGYAYGGHNDYVNQLLFIEVQGNCLTLLPTRMALMTVAIEAYQAGGFYGHALNMQTMLGNYRAAISYYEKIKNNILSDSEQERFAEEIFQFNCNIQREHDRASTAVYLERVAVDSLLQMSKEPILNSPHSESPSFSETQQFWSSSPGDRSVSDVSNARVPVSDDSDNQQSSASVWQRVP